MTRINIADISPDGVRIVIDWSKFVPGTSIFIPTINTDKAIEHIRKAARLNKNEIEKRVCIENGKYGVRVWRLQ